MKNTILLVFVAVFAISALSFAPYPAKTVDKEPLSVSNLLVTSSNLEAEIKSVNFEGITVTNIIQEDLVEFNKNEFLAKSILSTNNPSPSGTTWVKTYGGDKGDYLFCIQKTPDGGFITAGWTSSFGAGGQDFLVMKLDAYGEVVWSKTYGGKYDDTASSIIQTSDGGYIVAGYTTSFGNGNDVLVVKITSYGDVIWAKTFGGNRLDSVYTHGIKQTADGGYVLAISSKSYGNHVLVIKLNSAGEVTWVKEIGFKYLENIDYSSIISTSDGGYIFTAAIYTGSADSWDILTVKLASNGDLTWAKLYRVEGYWGNDQPFSIIQTSDGGYIINGIESTVSAGWDDIILIKINSIGNVEWAKAYGGKGNERLYYLEKTSDGGYIGAGRTDSICKDFCPGGTCNDLLIMKFDKNGDVVWSKTYKILKGTTDKNEANYIIEDKDGGYVVAGDIWGHVFNDGRNDFKALIIKVDSNGNLEGGSDYIQNINFTTNIPGNALKTPKFDNLVFNSISLVGQNASVTTQSPTIKVNQIVGIGTPNITENCNLFSDNFDRTEIGSNWTIVDDDFPSGKSNWVIQSGSLVQTGNIYRTDNEYSYFQGTHIITGNSDWSDYIFSFDLTSTDDDGVGAVFRYQDKNNYYRFIMVRDSSNKGPFRRIDKIVNGQPFQVLAIDKTNSYEVGKKYRISISVIGEEIKVYMDGVEILSAKDSTFKTGKIGFMTYAQQSAYFDNLCVSGIGTPNSPASLNSNEPQMNLRAYPGDNKVYLEWNPPKDTSNLLGYYLYRAKVSGGYTSPAHDFYITDTNYIDMNVENGTTYYYVCKVVYKDNTQSPPSNEVSVTPKALSPIINITDNGKVTSSSFTLTGKVDVGCEVYVNGNKVSVDSNGNFTATVTLNKGTNTIKIEVKNKAGDTKTITKTVTYEESNQPQSNQLTIILQINKPYMTVNGTEKEIDPGRGTVPVLVNGRTLVPIRAIIEEMGGTVSWDDAERKLTIKLKDKTIELWIDKKSAKVNGTPKELDVPPQIKNGRTMLPLRFVTEELGCNVLWDGTNKIIKITYKTVSESGLDKVVSELEKTISVSGGELTLSDGTKLTIPQNALSSDTKITLKSIENPSFSTVDTHAFELTGLSNLTKEIILSTTLQKGLKNEELDVYGYNHDKDQKIDLTYTYDPNTGSLNVTIDPKKLIASSKIASLFSYLAYGTYSQSLGFLDKLSVYVGFTPYYSPKQDEKIIRMPYYEQIGGSCASTSTQMLFAYAGKNYIDLYSILHALRVSDSDFGLGSYGFAWTLRDYISRTLGLPVQHIPYFSAPHLKWRILSELDKGHPVILNFGDHVVVVLGYTSKGEKIIIHDPQNVSPANSENGTMYTVRDWDWVESRHKSPFEKYYILYVDGSFASSNALSLMRPGNDEKHAMTGGEIAFYITNPQANKSASAYQLQIKPSNPNGYTWYKVAKQEEISVIPSDADTLKIKLIAFNGSTSPKNVTIKTDVSKDVSSKPFVSHSQTFIIPQAQLNSSSSVTYIHEYKLEDIRDFNLADKDGNQKIVINSTLSEGDFSDYFNVKATISVLPKVTSIEPKEGKPGDIITIKGFSFGKNRSSKSRVMIGDKKVDIVSWSDKEIKVKIPSDIVSGPVVVYTGENYEYESNKDVVFGAEINDGIYRLKLPIKRHGDNGWVGASVYLFIELKNGTIKQACFENHNVESVTVTQEVSGTYDNNGNINLNFKYTEIFSWIPVQQKLEYVYIGTITGKITEYYGDYGYIQGNLKEKIRKYDTGENLDLTTDFTIDASFFFEKWRCENKP